MIDQGVHLNVHMGLCHEKRAYHNVSQLIRLEIAGRRHAANLHLGVKIPGVNVRTQSLCRQSEHTSVLKVSRCYGVDDGGGVSPESGGMRGRGGGRCLPTVRSNSSY